MRLKRILIDVNSVVIYYSLGKLNGIGRTTLELIKALDRQENLPFDVILYSQNMKGIGGRELNTRFKRLHLYLPNRPKSNSLVKNLHLRELLGRYDLMHIPHNYSDTKHPEKCIVTIHDAMFYTFPEEAFNPEWCKKFYTPFAQKCKAIITCSESSKRDIVQYMDVDPQKVNVTHWGYNDKIFFPRSKTGNKYCGEKPFFISTSCDLGRKNTISIIRAFAKYVEMAKGEHDLILVWRNPPKEIIEEIRTLQIGNMVHFAKNITDEEMASLYSNATACFFPSLYEGFGLPVLESLASGTPVVTCQNSSLPEVGGDAAIYTDPFDLDAMAEIMRNFDIMATEDYENLKAKSLSQASKFSWEKCAQKTIGIYSKNLKD